jgi:hypothetical protein
MVACQHVVENGARTPNVDALIVVARVAAQHFWRLVLGCAKICHHEELVALLGQILLGHVEIDQGQLVIFYHDVIRVDISMTNALTL